MKINVKRLDHIQICIPTEKEDIARAFYLDLLGGLEIEKPEALKKNGGFWFQFGGVQVHIGAEEMTETTSKRHPAFEVENLNEVRKFLEGNNVLTKDDAEIPNVSLFSFFDPFMNRIEFLEKN
ncbi:glyoxalase [Lottiidibacillus patelloidae]|uniref:Glyoxalase n=1 Tax=Lottiidibacillus patelloidae TaxID=2670334 RepID=A0A263BXE5_9BACI|nr:glyoxalase [Lottiidibacillus patelloidae]OZM58399.1 glyoxalase [Lottiidibacillus patelloidae]